MSTVTSSAPVFIKATFNGRNGAGSISVPGLQTGDAILVFTNGNWAASFEYPVITVNDEIQQGSGADLSAVSFTLILVRWA